MSTGKAISLYSYALAIMVASSTTYSQGKREGGSKVACVASTVLLTHKYFCKKAYLFINELLIIKEFVNCECSSKSIEGVC